MFYINVYLLFPESLDNISLHTLMYSIDTCIDTCIRQNIFFLFCVATSTHMSPSSRLEMVFTFMPSCSFLTVPIYFYYIVCCVEMLYTVCLRGQSQICRQIIQPLLTVRVLPACSAKLDIKLILQAQISHNGMHLLL